MIRPTRHLILTATLAALAALAAPPAAAGVYASPQLRWASFSARPDAAEVTPNYFGYGAALSLGYSFGQAFDAGAFYSYLPARLRTASLGANDARLSFYGGELALRLAESVYVGLRGGAARYELSHQTRDDELPGLWKGPAGGLALGAVHKLSRQNFLQTSIELMHTIVQRDDNAMDGTEAFGRRRLDAFGLSLAYVFNSAASTRVESTIFKDFIDTLNFF